MLWIAFAAVLLWRSSTSFSPVPNLLCKYSSLLSSIQHGHSILLSQQDDNNQDSSRSVNVSGVTLKMAFDQDWAVADDAELKSERFTSPASLDLVHLLRRDSDVVLVGRATVQRDNCTLTVRRVPTYSKKQPVRVVMDPNLSLLKNSDKSFALFHDGLDTVVYCTNESSVNVFDDVSDNVTIVALPTQNDGTLSTRDVLEDLRSRGLYHIMVEGGPATASLFLQEQLVDRAILIRAPVKFVEPVPSNMSTITLTNAGLEFLGSCTSDEDVVDYWSRPELPWPTEELTDWPCQPKTSTL